MMYRQSPVFAIAALMLLILPFTSARADSYDETISVFKQAGASGRFFEKSYGSAVFPTVGKGGVGIGGAYGEGRVYEKGRYVGDATMAQLTVGWQFGGQAYSQIIFFQDQRAFKEFTSGNCEFGAQAKAGAITAGASAAATTAGASASASGGQHDARTAGRYENGMATFTVAKGGLMYEASIGGQKVSYNARK